MMAPRKFEAEKNRPFVKERGRQRMCLRPKEGETR
jgi:hypothetical protein